MVKCKAVVPEAQKENLVECIKILGGAPVVHKDEVSVEYSGEKEATMIALFEHYTHHEIQLLQ